MADEPTAVRRMADEEVAALAARMLRREVWLVWADDPRVLVETFPVLMMADLSEEFAASIGAAYAPMDQAMPSAVNGHPVFFACTLIHRDDCEALANEYERLEALVGTPT